MFKKSLLLAVFALFLAGCASLSISSDENVLPEGDFTLQEEGLFHGSVYVRGFVDVQKVPEAWCEEDCEIHDYILFVIEETGSDGFREFLDANKGNAYTGRDSVGLGCIRDGVVAYDNHSDELGMKHFELSSGLSNLILSSELGREINLKLTKLPLGAGRGAPTCYGHFTEVELYEADSPEQE